MDRRKFFIAGWLVLCAAGAHAQSEGAKLDTQVSYTGSGTVDDTHKIYVLLWDTPDFVKGDAHVPPVAVQSVASKSEVAHFDGLTKDSVYLALVFDPSGKWDAQSPPPTGSSIGLYATEPGTPAPIKLDAGQVTKVTAPFDDSVKMP